jgi:hypothetical protein
MESNKQLCQGKANAFLGQCLRKGIIERDGKLYCWQHDPEKLRKEAAERWEQRKKEIAEIERKQDERITRRKLEEQSGVNKLTNEDLEKIIKFGGIYKLIQDVERNTA